jgi:hypothetical protein
MTLGELYSIGAKQIWRSLWRIGHCPVPKLEPSANWRLSGFLSAHSLNFIGLSDAPLDCPVRQQSNGQLCPTLDCATVRIVCSTRS